MTGSAADLRELASVELGYVLRIEGISTSFVSRPELADGTWLDDRTTQLECLALPKFSMGINIRKGTFTTNTTTFSLEDVDDSLADLFASVRADVEELEFTIGAGTAAVADQGTSFWGKHVGIERFGAAGQRMQYPAIPNWNVGYRHVGKFDASSADLPRTPITAKPYVWSGRRAVLLRVFHNVLAAPGDLSGVNWTAPANSDVIWFGTVLDAGGVSGKTWSLECAGPESWLEKTLGQDTWLNPASVSDVELQFAENEGLIGGWLCEYGSSVGLGHSILNEEVYGSDEFTTSFTDGDIETIRSELDTWLQALAAAAGTDGTYAASGFQPKTVAFVADPGRLEISITSNVDNHGAALVLIMHRKVWERLGYLPGFQGGPPPAVQDAGYIDHLEHTDSRFVRFVSPEEWQNGIPHPDGNWEWPTGDYWAAAFTTMPPGEWPGTLNKAGAGVSAPNYNYNGGHTRSWIPMYPGGAFTIPADLSLPVEIEIGLSGQAGVFLEGQHDAAPCSAVDDPDTAYSIGDGVGSVDRTRLFVLYGPRRMTNDFNDPENEDFTEAQPCRASWVNDSGQIKISATLGNPRLVIHEWLEPRDFGINRPRLVDNWVGLGNTVEEGNRIHILPISHFGANDNGLDPIHVHMQAALLSTGTGTGFSGFYKAPGSIDEGENEPDGDGEPNPKYVKDYDTFPFGLQIPASRVQPPAEWWKEWQKLEQPLRYGKLAYVGQASGADVLQALMEPLGLCPTLRDGKFGMFCPWDQISQDDADITITSEAYSSGVRGPASARPRQALRVFAPIDKLLLKYSWNILDAAPAHQETISATDHGVRYRTQNVEQPISAHALRLGHDWLPALKTRWKRGFTWWGKRHFKVAGQRLQRLKGQDCWPGTRVLYTDPWLVDPIGTYETVANFPGFVDKITYDCAKEEAIVDFLIQEDGALGLHYYAPMARVFAYDNGDPYVLYCYDDMYEVGFGHVDTKWFVEPAWSDAGGDLDIELLQYNGETWSGGIFGTVQSVSIVEGAASITLTGALTGATFYRDKDTIAIPREYANQGAAWAKALFAGIANEDGEVNGSTANSVKFNGV